MNFDDIPTPETSELMRLNGEAIAQCKTRPAIWPKMQDLEKRLAMARLSLTPFANYACDEPHVDEPKCHNCIARDVLAFTAPKL